MSGVGASLWARIVEGRWVEYMVAMLNTGMLEIISVGEGDKIMETCAYFGEDDGWDSPLRLAVVRVRGKREYESNTWYVDWEDVLEELRSLASKDYSWCPKDCELSLLRVLYEWSGEEWLGVLIGSRLAACY